MSDDHAVARYYDRNTGRFLRFGGGRSALAIHRELWAPGVRNAEEAKRTVNRMLGDAIAQRVGDVPTVLDLGCGVGGTLLDLAERFPEARLHGVTVSRGQVKIAGDLIRDRGLERRCHVHFGDFQHLELAGEHQDLRADAVIAVESFAHASDPRGFFRTAAARLRPGGILLLVDDFLMVEPHTLQGRDARLLNDFTSGWRLGGLLTPAAAQAHAQAAGWSLEEERDLTPLIRLGRPRDHVIRFLAPLFSRMGLVGVAFFGNMIGGNALQEGLKSGVFGYRLLTLVQRHD